MVCFLTLQHARMLQDCLCMHKIRLHSFWYVQLDGIVHVAGLCSQFRAYAKLCAQYQSQHVYSSGSLMCSKLV